jgi:hypothetical protein
MFGRIKISGRGYYGMAKTLKSIDSYREMFRDCWDINPVISCLVNQHRFAIVYPETCHPRSSEEHRLVLYPICLDSRYISLGISCV